MLTKIPQVSKLGSIVNRVFGEKPRVLRVGLKGVLCVLFLCLFLAPLGAQTTESQIAGSNVSPALVFHNIGWNFLDSITWNYGLNYIGGGLPVIILKVTCVTWAKISDWATAKPAICNFVSALRRPNRYIVTGRATGTT